MSIEIYFKDLTKDKQQKIIDTLGNNYNSMPITTINIEYGD